MGLDLVTYLRTEWVSAALCTNQTPKSAAVCLQLGTEDGRIVTFIPRTVKSLLTSSAEADGVLSVSARRQLRQQREQRRTAFITYLDQRADDLVEVEDESVDVVVSLQAAERMRTNGLDWQRSIREAGRVLKPGGRFLFVEQTEVDGVSYLKCVERFTATTDDEWEKHQADDVMRYPVFDDIGFDNVDLVLVPHIAGVAIKSKYGGMTEAEFDRRQTKEEQSRIEDIAIEAFEGRKRKRRKRKKAKDGEEGAEDDTDSDASKTTTGF